MRTSQKQVISELQTLRFGSVEFYDVACRYFCRRYRVIQNCGLFFMSMAVLYLAIVFMQQGNWLFDIKFCVFTLFFVAIGWAPYRIGRYGIEMIKTARRANTQHQMNALHFIATTSKPVRGDPVGSFVLQQFGDEKHAAYR
jgi:hypothetical protein